MVIGVDTWQGRAQALGAELVAAGKLSSPSWQRAVRETPRHHFVPRFYQRRPGQAGWHLVDAEDPTSHAQWWNEAYANTSLVTEIGDVPDGGRDTTGPVSSSSAPGLMTRMLEMLDIRDGMRVLEIGTGTGYNAALLCHRLGEANVFSVDIDPHLVTTARHRLAGLGYRPTVAAADGAAGLPDHAPYDRIIVTCAVSRVPWSWAEQVTDGGFVLVDVKVNAVVGNLVLLHRETDQLVGRFDSGSATFMQMRTPMFSHEPTPEPARDHSDARYRTTTLSIKRPWEHSMVWFLLHLTVPGRVEFGYDMDPATGGIGPMYLYSRDGSWCEISTTSDGTRHVRERGPLPLWQTLEQLHEMWARMGQPGWDRFGITVRQHSQTVWLDDPDNAHRWVVH